MFDILMETAFNDPSRLKRGGCAGRVALETGGIIVVKALHFAWDLLARILEFDSTTTNLLFLQTA